MHNKSSKMMWPSQLHAHARSNHTAVLQNFSHILPPRPPLVITTSDTLAVPDLEGEVVAHEGRKLLHVELQEGGHGGHLGEA